MKRQAATSKPRPYRFRIISEIIGELKKVVWPTRREAIRLCLMVIFVSAIGGLFLGAADYGFTQLVEKVLLGGR